jgi:hypothetical protein
MIQVKKKDRKKLKKREEKILERLANEHEVRESPMMSASNVSYEVSERVEATAWGGVAAMHQLSLAIGLTQALDDQVHVLKIHKPYHESDHILNIALNILAGGTSLEDLELRRRDVSYMNALGAERIPDPTTAGDFTRRFTDEAAVLNLMEAINSVRPGVWKELPAKERRKAVIDTDGTLAPTTGERKEGMGLSYKGIWGYHPLVVSLANTREALFLVNRSGNAVSHEGAAAYMDHAVALVRESFKEVWLRGDTDFSLTKHFDRWTEDGVHFVFGMDAMKNLVNIAGELGEKCWKPLVRRTKRACKGKRRKRRDNVKERIVKEKRYKNIRLKSEQVSEFSYRPGKCMRDYRVVVVRKNLSVEKGEDVLFDDVRYFFYITNDTKMSARQVVRFINGRCDHENDIEQLKNGINAMRMPSGDLYSNGAYMVMAALAWNLKAWYGVLMPDKKTGAEVVRMEFPRFLNGFMAIPAQVLEQARQIKLRVLAWTPYLEAFLEMFTWMRARRFAYRL